jgi:UDP-2-acetamido-3-amino-2,3-dideoxy-glucuronate N-acetyltransferase
VVSGKASLVGSLLTMSSPSFIHPTAVIDQPCEIGAGTKVWHFSHICEGATIGEQCNLGQNVMIAGGVRVGRNVKIQNNVSVYSGTTIEDDVLVHDARPPPLLGRRGGAHQP